MELYYCEKCGMRIPQAELAASANAGKYWCLRCKPATADASTHKTPVRNSQILTPAKRNSSVHAPASRKVVTVAGPVAPKTPWLYPTAGGAAALLLGIVIFGSSENSKPAALAPKHTEPSPAVHSGPTSPPSTTISVASVNRSITAAPTPVSHVEEPRPAPAHETTVAAPPSDPKEEAALKAFDELQRSGKTGEQQIAAFEVFIAKFDDAIVVARARSQLAELKAALPPAPSLPAVAARGIDVERSSINTKIETATAPPVVNAPDTSVKEAPPEKQPEPDADASRVAYGEFLDRFWSSLARRQSPAASKALAQAAGEPALKARSKELAEERGALKLYDDFVQSVTRGLRSLSDQDYVELQRGKSSALKVGKRGDFQVSAVKDDVITLDAHGMSMSVPIDSLSFSTWVKLAELDWKATPPRADLQLFVRLLEATPESADIPKFHTQLTALDGKNSSADIIGVFSRRIARLEALHQESLEAAADAAFAKLTKIAESKDRAALANALKDFRRTSGSTEFAAKNALALKVFETKSAPIPVADGLAAYFPFDEGSGRTSSDVSGNLREAQLSNCAWVPGRLGTALNFAAKDAVATFNAVSIKTNALTLCCWVKHHENTGRYERYITLSGDNAIIRRNTGGRLEAVLRINNNLEFLSSPDNLDNDRWYHVAITWDGQDMRLYRDGALASSAPKPGVLDPVVHGSISWAGGEQMGGSIDEARIYNRALTDAEVRQLAEQKATKE